MGLARGEEGSQTRALREGNDQNHGRQHRLLTNDTMAKIPEWEETGDDGKLPDSQADRQSCSVKFGLHASPHGHLMVNPHPFLTPRGPDRK